MLNNFHKKLLDAGKGHQVCRKAAQSLQKEVGQNIKYKNRNKRFRDGDPFWEGVMNDKFPHNRKPSHRHVCGELWNLKGQNNRGGRGKWTQNTCLTTTTSGEVVQMLVYAATEWELGREAQTASLVPQGKDQI